MSGLRTKSTAHIVLAAFLLFFYRKIFGRYLRFQVYSYLAVGALNTGWNVLWFHILYYYVFLPVQHYLPPHLPAHSLALILSFIVTFPVGFWLMRTFVFRKGNTPIIEQFSKYVYVMVQGILLEYGIVRLAIEILRWEATLSKLSASAIVAVANFFIQRHFTFRAKVSP